MKSFLLLTIASGILTSLFMWGFVRGLEIEQQASSDLWAHRCYQAELRGEDEFLETYCRGK